SRLRNIVKEYYGGDTIRGSIKVGERLDTYYGWDWEKSPTGEIVYENGLPRYIDQRVNLGFHNHDWDFGLSNSFRYKSLSFSFLFDGRVGGKLYNGVEGKLYEGGMHKSTANSFRDDAYDQRKTYVGNGVVVTSGAVQYDVQGNIISDTRRFAPNTIAANYIDWIFKTYTDGVDGALLYDKTFVKLREVVISYTFPNNLLKKTPFSQASISAVGRNLWLKTKVPYLDPDGYAGLDLAEPTARNIGINLNLKF
ncbi:MAG TPA: hypothetical protein VK907_06605, partial [Phnomibacter sp.]|nr:hypothetical protein [Phnomibacter sp.]